MHSSLLGLVGAAVPSTLNTLMQSAFEDPPGRTVAAPMLGIAAIPASATAMEIKPHAEPVRREPVR